MAVPHLVRVFISRCILSPSQYPSPPHPTDAQFTIPTKLVAVMHDNPTPSVIDTKPSMTSMTSADSAHSLITSYNPSSGVTPHSLLAWIAQCEDQFTFFNSRHSEKLTAADQILLMGLRMEDPGMRQWWIQGKE